MARKPCGRLIKSPNMLNGVPCRYERAKGKQRCVWHWLMSQPADVQAAFAYRRSIKTSDAERRSRVPEREWPPGERWCSGCQSFVPLFYARGSRCRACASVASHAGRVEREYGISGAEYDRLLRAQGGRCYICQRRPIKKRLAVDHDHRTGEVRGLLCANNENGCNRAVIANLEAAVDGGLQAAKRAVAYLEDPPYRRLQRGDRVYADVQPIAGPPPQPPPF